MTTRNHVRGFTLIELLVVIVIVATVLSIAVLSLGIVGDDRDLKTERARLVSLIETVQDEAMMQGREFGIEVVATWHPAYLLRQPSAKRETWEDIKRVNRLLGRPEVPPAT